MTKQALGRLTVALMATPLMAVALSSCIQDERPSMEADIETIRVSGIDPATLLVSPSDAQRNLLSDETAVVYHLASGVSDEQLANVQLDFTLSQGARVAPVDPSNTSFGGQNVVRYVVTSEDGQYRRYYSIQFLPAPAINPVFTFDDPRLDADGSYYEWPFASSAGSDGGSLNIWGTGNSGFKLSQWNATAENYPTSATDIARSGKAAKLTTRSTGFLGSMSGRPIAAGNLFIGTFDVTKAFSNPLEGTQFGRPINRKPLSFRGYYKWQAGAQYQNQRQRPAEGPGENGTDLPQVYAVLYRNTDDSGNPVVLNGTNILTHPNTMAIAMVESFTTTGVEATSPWASFDVTFDYGSRELVNEVLARSGYSLAVVFSSSRNGARFEGAIGSTLIIDDIEVVF